MRFAGLQHDPEKWIPLFGRRSCSTKKPERDDKSKKSHPALVLGALALPVLGGCDLDGGSGYLEIKAIPPAPALALYLDQVKLDPIRNGTAVLREKAGTVKLQADIDGTGRLALLCSVEIKKNRITSVTVSVMIRQPRCQCGRAGASDTPANRMCIG